MAKIEISKYNHGWPEAYNQEAQALRELFGDSVSEIFHIGSTAVPGMAARATVDVLLVVKDIAAVSDKISALCVNGYTVDSSDFDSEKVVLHKETAVEGETVRTVSLYIMNETNEEGVNKAVGFVRTLRSDEDMALKYAEIKKKLAERYPNDDAAYAVGKAKWLDGDNPFEDEASAYEEAPVEETEKEEAPAAFVAPVPVASTEAEAPAQDAVAEEAPTQEETAQDAVAEEASAEEAPTQEETAQDAVAEEASAEEAPTQEETAEEKTTDAVFVPIVAPSASASPAEREDDKKDEVPYQSCEEVPVEEEITVAPVETAPKIKKPKPKKTKKDKKAKEEDVEETEAPKKKSRKSSKKKKKQSYVSIGACLLGTAGFFAGTFLFNGAILGLIIGLVAGGLAGFGMSVFGRK